VESPGSAELRPPRRRAHLAAKFGVWSFFEKQQFEFVSTLDGPAVIAGDPVRQNAVSSAFSSAAA